MKVAHIGIAIEQLDDAAKAFTTLLGFEAEEIEEVAEQKVNTAIYKAGGTGLELLEATAPDSPIAKYIAKKGPGIHHICLIVDDLEADLKRLTDAGIRLIDETPRIGAGGKKIAFVHPKSTAGILIELQQQ